VAHPKGQSANARLLDLSTNSESLMAMGSTSLRAVSHMNDAMLRSVSAMHEELSRFVKHRLTRDIELQQDIAACGSPADAFQLYAQFLQTSMSDYWQEMTRLGTLSAENGLNGFARLQEQGSQVGREAAATAKPAERQADKQKDHRAA